MSEFIVLYFMKKKRSRKNHAFGLTMNEYFIRLEFEFTFRIHDIHV